MAKSRIRSILCRNPTSADSWMDRGSSLCPRVFSCGCLVASAFSDRRHGCSSSPTLRPREHDDCVSTRTKKNAAASSASLLGRRRALPGTGPSSSCSSGLPGAHSRKPGQVRRVPTHQPQPPTTVRHSEKGTCHLIPHIYCYYFFRFFFLFGAED